jgi:selenium metabolism protein YedF
MKELDLRGLACPQPVVLTRKTLLEGERELRVLVDDQVAVNNVTRMADSLGAEVKTTACEGEFLLEIALADEAILEEPEEGVTFFLSAETIGREEPELGRILMKMLLNALADAALPPARLLLMHSGVKLVVEGADSVPALQNLECLGTQILVCGTCLDYFGLREKMVVGTISNMQEISEAMTSASNTVTI